MFLKALGRTKYFHCKYFMGGKMYAFFFFKVKIFFEEQRRKWKLASLSCGVGGIGSILCI